MGEKEEGLVGCPARVIMERFFKAGDDEWCPIGKQICCVPPFHKCFRE